MTRDELVAALREKTRVLYEGKGTPHRRCGIALAEAFDRETAAYQALRRGGLTGEGSAARSSRGSSSSASSSATPTRPARRPRC